jgi:hypothetical protein
MTDLMLIEMAAVLTKRGGLLPGGTRAPIMRAFCG